MNALYGFNIVFAGVQNLIKAIKKSFLKIVFSELKQGQEMYLVTKMNIKEQMLYNIYI